MSVKVLNANTNDTLERIFHEPNRLAIISTVCAADDGITFGALKEACNLTDGNLSRHLKALEESEVVRIEKKFVDNKPRTTVFITRAGLKRFSEYLDALNDVLRTAKESLPADRKEVSRTVSGLERHVPA